MPRVEDKTIGYVENEESSFAASLLPGHQECDRFKSIQVCNCSQSAH